MKGSSSKNAPNVLKKLVLLGNKQGSIKLKDLSPMLQLGEDETLMFLRQQFPQGKGAEIYHHDDECWVDMNAEAMQYMLPVTPTEWLELQKILAEIPSKNHVQASLKRKITENFPITKLMGILSQLEMWDEGMDHEDQVLIKKIEEAAHEKTHIQVKAKDGKSYSMFPCKIVHIEGDLSLIAEDSQDRCLMIMSIKDVASIEHMPSSRTSRVTPFEIDEFIAAIRAMNEKETRLILKIHDSQSLNLFPNHHFLGKPCMITNPNGDLIWAAYVEPCEALYEWLSSLGKNVEILDPIKFKEEYLSYCEEKVRKIA